MKVALVHDWLTGLRGGEKVLEVLCEIFPEATLFTLLHVPGSTSPLIEDRPVRTAFTQSLPGARRFYRWYLPLFPWAIESLNLEGYDLVVSTSHCVAKGVLAPPNAPHISYCHTPMRYVWDRFPDYFGTGFTAKFVFGPFAHYLRLWDAASTPRVDRIIANSAHVAARVRRFWGREVDAVIPPPVDTDFFVPAEAEDPENYFLIVSALVPYKRVDLAIDAFKGRKERLLIVGTGPEEERLRQRAGPNVELLGAVSSSELLGLYQRARGSLLPGVEDFGIAPVESQACGRPVVAFRGGGALESVKDGETGVFFDEATPASLSAAVDKLLSLSFNRVVVRSWALQFSRSRFKQAIESFVEETLADK